MKVNVTIDDILAEENISEAIKYLKSKNDSAGNDNIRPSQFETYWDINKNDITDLLKKGQYEPDATRQFEQVSKKSKVRSLYVMNTVDRMLARAVSQVLSVEIDGYLSSGCFAYRKGLGTRDFAIYAAESIESGAEWAAEADIKNFFDHIPHENLLKKLECIIEDKPLLKLIKSLIECKIESDEGIFRIAEGIMPGMPLSPLLSNIYLMDTDKVCTERFSCYCRYGDDIRVFCRTKGEAETALSYVRQAISQNGLQVNEKKCGTFEAVKRPYLGYELKEKNGHILVELVTKKNRPIYHEWQKSSIKEIDHNYHLINDGVLNKKDFTLLFENEEGRRYIPVEILDSLSIYSNIIFSSNFFEVANEFGFSVNVIDKIGNQVGRFIPANWKRDFKTEMAQIRLLSDEKEHLKLARDFQYANIFNIRAALRYYERRGHNELITEAVSEITEILAKVKLTKNIDSLMIYEAQARQKYFHCFNVIMAADDFEFTKRTRRPPEDALNAMISFGNTLLYTRIANEIYNSSLDIRFGIVHSSYKRPENLNLDIADLFKPILVDRTIFTLVNRKMLNEIRDFEETANGGVHMTYRAKRIFIREFETKLNTLVNGENGKSSYSDIIKKEIRKLQGYFKNGNKYKPYKYVN